MINYEIVFIPHHSIFFACVYIKKKNEKVDYNNIKKKFN